MAIIKQRRGTASQWTLANPILGAGEQGVETDTNKFKFGNGTSHWTDLTYFIDTDDIQTMIAAEVSEVDPATSDAAGIVELATTSEATTGTDTTRAVTPAGLKAALNALINGAPSALDTLKEIADQLATDESAVAALTTTVSGKMAKSANLSDVASVATALTNLGAMAASIKLNGITAPDGAVNMNSQKLTSLAAGTNPTDGANYSQVSSKMANDVVTGLLGLVPNIVIPVGYDVSGSSWHSSTYAPFATNANIFFLFFGGVDDGSHDPFATTGPAAWFVLS